ncbi:MAG: MFS transporter [Chloroflexota bacterium]
MTQVRTTGQSIVPSTSRLVLQLGAATAARIFLNTARRFAYPFASVLSRGLGVPLTAVTSLLAANQVTGLLSPLFGPLSDRWGYRIMMLVGLVMLAVGMLLGGWLGVFWAMLPALFLAGLGKSIFDPALQAYTGEKVPYHRRGLAIGFIEFSWAGSSLLGIPLMGLLIDRLGWRSPFFVLGGCGLVSAFVLGLLIPQERSRRNLSRRVNGFRQAWLLLRQERPALSALAFGFLLSIANDNLFVVYGAWLEESFGLSTVALGSAALAIGAAELLGEGLTASVADRLGLKRAVIAALTLSTFSYALLPWASRNLPLALTGLFFTFLTFEFTIVTAFSLFTELLPGARATMMSASTATTSLGRVIGAVMGGAVWMAGGLVATGFVSAAISGLALAVIAWGLRDWRVADR